MNPTKPSMHLLKAIIIGLSITIVLLAGLMHKGHAQTIVHSQPQDTSKVLWTGTYPVISVNEFRGRKIAKINLQKAEVLVSNTGEVSVPRRPKYYSFYCNDTLKPGNIVSINWLIKP